MVRFEFMSLLGGEFVRIRVDKLVELWGLIVLVNKNKLVSWQLYKLMRLRVVP